MKIIVYECKKILKLPLLVILILFTFLFYNLFMNIQYYPDDDASLAAGVELSDALMERHGTSLPYSDIYVLEEIKQQQLQTLNTLVKENSVLSNEGIRSWQQLREMNVDSMEKEVQEAKWEIDFGSGMREVFLYQCIENIDEHMEYIPFMGIEKGKEKEAARKIYKARISHSDTDSNEAGCTRIAQVIGRNKMSLLPEGALHRTNGNVAILGMLLILSCLLLILPYQIRERLAHVNPLFAATNTGRAIWGIRYVAAVLSCLFVCLVQVVIFLCILKKRGILKYTSCPTSGNGWDYLWYDMSFGTYLLLYISTAVLFALAVMTLFYLISRMVPNYIVGLAVGLPAAVLLGVLYIRIMSDFLFVTAYSWWLCMQLGMILGAFLLAVVIVLGMRISDRKRDVMV